MVALHVLQPLVAVGERADHAEVRVGALSRVRRAGRPRHDRARPALGGVVRVRHRVVPSRLERHARRAVRRRHERPRRVPRHAVPRLVGHEEVEVGEFGSRDERPAPERRERIARHQVAHRRHTARRAHRHPAPHEHALAEHAELVHPVSPVIVDVVRRAAVVAREQHERASGLRERGIHHAAAPDFSRRTVRAMRRDRQLDAAWEEARPAKRILTAVAIKADRVAGKPEQREGSVSGVRAARTPDRGVGDVRQHDLRLHAIRLRVDRPVGEQTGGAVALDVVEARDAGGRRRRDVERHGGGEHARIPARARHGERGETGLVVVRVRDRVVRPRHEARARAGQRHDGRRRARTAGGKRLHGNRGHLHAADRRSRDERARSPRRQHLVLHDIVERGHAFGGEDGHPVVDQLTRTVHREPVEALRGLAGDAVARTIRVVGEDGENIPGFAQHGRNIVVGVRVEAIAAACPHGLVFQCESISFAQTECTGGLEPTLPAVIVQSAVHRIAVLDEADAP